MDIFLPVVYAVLTKRQLFPYFSTRVRVSYLRTEASLITHSINISGEKLGLYEQGEEKFGAFASRFYGLVRLIPTMRRFYRFVVQTLNEQGFSSVLDIGCGPGIVLLKITTLHKGEFYGIDPSPQMVSIATGKADKLGLSDKVKFEVGSSRSIPGSTNFDIIYSSLSFHHWKDRERSLKDILERLNHNGKIMIFEVEDDGSFNRRFVRSHLMSKDDFISIGTNIDRTPDIIEREGYICAIFK